MTETITIPGYSIASRLGQGGMASVYLAVQHSFEREVALKVMSPLLNSDPSFAARFKREARIVAQLSHASIVPVFEVGEHNSCHYLSMEYLSGGDLKRRVLDGERDLSLALNVCTALSAALDVAHRKGFVHRDIKPENILFREDGTPVLTDFGIARALDSGRSMTLAGMLVGTPDYMSPEQVKGLELDGRSDLYSMGIVFYEILTGAVPFKADSTLSVALKQVGEPLPSLPPEHAAYQEFLDCLTAKDREQRFASGAEVIRALRVIGTGRAVRNRAGMLALAAAESSDLRASTIPTPRPTSETYLSQPTLAWPRAEPSRETLAARSPESAVSAADSEQHSSRSAASSTGSMLHPAGPAASATGPMFYPAESAASSAEPALHSSGPESSASVGQAGGSPASAGMQWAPWLAKVSQPVWVGVAAAVAVLAVGVALIVISQHRDPRPSAKTAPAQLAQAPAANTSDAASQVAASGQSPQPSTTSAPPETAPATQTPSSKALSPETPMSGSATAVNTARPQALAALTSQTTPGAQLAKSDDAVEAPAAQDSQARAEAVAAARRRRLAEERRQRKATETQVLAQRAAELKAAQLQAQEAQIQELLAAATSEYAAGALWQPEGANAADRYRNILRIQPGRAEALAGAQRVANVLAAEAAQTESVGDIFAARRLIDQVQTLQPNHPKLPELQERLEKLQTVPAGPDARDRLRLDKAAKYIARAVVDLDRTPLDFRAADDATDQYDRALSAAAMAPGLPSLKERLIVAYATAVQTELSNHEPKRAQKLINTAHKRKWSSDELDQLEASLKSGSAPTAQIKEAGATGAAH
jgi:serine/threonine-protein kinase PpkA